MNLKFYTGGLVSTNGYYLEKDGTSVLVDAPAGVFQWLQEQGHVPDALLLTHQHFDHVEDAHLFDVPIYAFAPFSRDLVLDEKARAWGLPVQVPEFTVTKVLENKDSLEFSGLAFDLFHVPGHSPDSLVFSLPSDELAFVGDTLFCGGVGRSDLPGGSNQLLVNGIRQKITSLPEATQLFPGHGPKTTPAAERNNPYLD